MSKQSNTDAGKSSGNKPLDGTGVPSKIKDENTQNDERSTEQYTDDDGEVREGVRTMNPNRNVDKDEATNIGGYRS